MKVFTVGLDQKPPVKDASDPPSEKAAGGSPPPGYATATKIAHIPLPMGPEIPQPPVPIVVRKSRGYKGILMVMLAVFLMALFALTLSEIAYNRQRDENFFRLRWAELKHRLGYGDNAFDYYHRANAVLNNDRFFSLGKNKELAEALIQQSEPTSSSTTGPPPSSSPEPIVAIDSFPPKPSSLEQQPDGAGGMIRDARLQFLKTILQKIKQHAEDMGFDGTMQVSVIEVEPQIDEPFSPFGSQHQPPHPMGKPSGQPQSFHPLLPNFFPHFPIEDQPKSDSFMDGFGEFHQPTFMQNNQVVEQNRARGNGPFGGTPWPPHDDDSSPHQPPHTGGDFVDIGTVHWPRANANPFRPDNFFHPANNWQVLPPQQQQSFPQPPHILPRPPSFDRWSGQNNVVDGGDDSSQQQQPPQHPHQQPHQPSMIQIFPQQPPLPMLPPMMGPNNGQQPPQEPSNEGDSSNSSPSQEVVGEIYGRKFGRMLQDIIANRIQGFQNMQQQQMNPLMLPPAALMGAQQQQQQRPDQPPRMPFGGDMMNGPMPMGMGGPPFFPQQPQGPQQQMPMPQQWWQPQGQQQQIAPSNMKEENGKQDLPPPPPIIFFPMGQGPQGQQGQQPPFPSFGMGVQNKDIMGQRKEFSQQQQQPPQLQFPVFKNFIPPEDRIQVEPPQTFPNPPHQMADGPIHPRAGNNDESAVKTVVDNNMAGPRGWTHQLPKTFSSQQQPPQESNSDEQAGQMPASRSGSPEEGPSFADNEPVASKVDATTSTHSKSNSASSEQQQLPEQPPTGNENEDVWLVAPPHRTQPPRRPPPSFEVESSTGDSSAPSISPVDFPAVKFPMNAATNNNGEMKEDKAQQQQKTPLSSPQQDHQPAQPLLSNPVFFQVDDPSSIEQQPPRTVVA